MIRTCSDKDLLLGRWCPHVRDCRSVPACRMNLWAGGLSCRPISVSALPCAESAAWWQTD